MLSSALRLCFNLSMLSGGALHQFSNARAIDCMRLGRRIPGVAV